MVYSEIARKALPKLPRNTPTLFEICQMMDALGIDRSQRRAEIDPGLLRYLSLELYWSDEEIAAQVICLLPRSLSSGVLKVSI